MPLLYPSIVRFPPTSYKENVINIIYSIYNINNGYSSLATASRFEIDSYLTASDLLLIRAGGVLVDFFLIFPLFCS